MTSKIDVDHLAELTKLSVTDKEKEKLSNQLKETVDYINVLDELETSAVQPTFQVTGQFNPGREDQPKDFLDQDSGLANAPRKNKGYFVVEKISWG